MKLSLSALAAAGALTCATSAPSAETLPPAQQLFADLGLSGGEIVQVFVADTGATLDVVVAGQGAPMQFTLEPDPVMDPETPVYEVRDDGLRIPHRFDSIVTFSGVLPDVDGSRVAASWWGEGLHARVRYDEDLEYWIQPLEIGGAQLADYHVLYTRDDVLPVEGACGTDLIAQPPSLQAPPHGAPLFGHTVDICELGVDADFEYFQDHGSSLGGVRLQVLTVIHLMNVQFEIEVGIRHFISALIVRSTSNDPYTTTDPSALLSQFRSEWEGPQSGLPRDVAELFTGKNLNGGVIGIAWLSSICGSFGYNVVQSDFTFNFACKTDLSAHELGHNWSAGHCSCTSNTMNPFITCANKFHPSFTIPQIVSFRNAVGCLSQGLPSMHVSDITTSTAGGGGTHYGLATVTVVDVQGNPIAGVRVRGKFTGDVGGVAGAVTNANGVATLRSKTSSNTPPNFEFCVQGMTSPAYEYDSYLDDETCQSQ